MKNKTKKKKNERNEEMSQHRLWLDEENWVATMHNDGYNMHSFAMCNMHFPPGCFMRFFSSLAFAHMQNERTGNIFRLWTGKNRIDRLQGDGIAAKLVE